MSAPTDAAFEALVRNAYRRYDFDGNRARQRWLASVEVDEDGCWIWIGVTRHQYSHQRGQRYPLFQCGPAKRNLSPFTWMCRLWAPDLLGKVPRNSRYRRCRKPLCVRPACLGMDKPYRPRANYDPEQVMKLRSEGLTWKQVAERINVSYETMHSFGRRKGNRVYTNVTPEEGAEMLRLYNDGMPRCEIAEKTGRHAETVSRWIRNLQKGQATNAQT